MATHSRISAWRILWTEEPGVLHYIGSQRVVHDRNDLAHMHTCYRARHKVTQSDIVASMRKEVVWLIRCLFSPSKLELGCLRD